MAAPELRPGGHGRQPAITVDGRIWTYAEFHDLVDRAAGDAAGTRVVSATGRDLVAALATVFGAAAAGVPALLTDPADATPVLGTLPDGAFLVVVTSGTSGRPRPVIRTAASWTSSFAPLAEIAGIDAADRVLLTGPLHVTLHLFAAVHTLALGAELTDQPGRATAVHAVPTVLADLLATLPPQAPLRTAVVAGSALPATVADRAQARGIAVTEYYGAAELSFVTARRVPDPMRPFPGAQVSLRDGRLWVRSPYLSLGYPAGVDGPLQRDDDGFATVGDLADFDPDGGVIIRGRGDAAITTGGATVIAEDVETALATLPSVAAVAVVGVPHARLGQVVTAVIEPIPGCDLSGLRAAARTLLRDQSLPRRWLITDRLPRTPGGKIARGQVVAAAAQLAGSPLAANQRLADQPPGADPAARELPLRPLP